MPPPLPFPYPIRVGTDICGIPRIRRLLSGPHAGPFIRRLLSPEELARASPVLPRVLEAIQVRENLTSRFWSGTTSDEKRCLKRANPKALATWLGRLSTSAKREKLELIEALEAHEESHRELFYRVAPHLAGRFAAKEAAFKAHSHLPSNLAFHDVVILPQSDFADLYRATPPDGLVAARPLAVIKPGRGMRDQTAMVSISHDGEYATAVCLGFEQDPQGDGQPEETATAD